MKQLNTWMTQTDPAFGEKRRKLVAACAAFWTILGAVIASTGFSSINRDARAFIIGSILLAALAGIGATIAALRGMRRLAIPFLLVSVLYPTYFFWAFSLIPLALAGYLLFLPRKGRRLTLTWKAIFLSIFGVAVLAVVISLSVTLKVGPAKLSTGTVAPIAKIQTLLTIYVTSAINLRDGEQVLVRVRAAKPGGKFFVSECATVADANVGGCGDQLAAQPFGVTDPSGVGLIMFRVQASAAIKPYDTTASQPCTDQCVLVATGGFGGTFVYAPLKFSTR